MPTLFERIIAREIPSDIVYEDEWTVAFRDIQPQAPFHVLVVPRRPIGRFSEATDDDAALLGRLFLAAEKVASAAGYTERGYRVTVNQGPDAGQIVQHIHLHVMAGREMGWPPG